MIWITGLYCPAGVQYVSFGFQLNVLQLTFLAYILQLGRLRYIYILAVTAGVYFTKKITGVYDNNNMHYSSQWEIKAVVRSYTLTQNEKLNCT